MTVTVYSADLVIPITAPSMLGGSVAVEDGRIRHVGDRDWVLRSLTDAGVAFDEVYWPGVLIPGLVNAHTHLQYTRMAELGRGQYDGFEDWANAFNRIYDDPARQDWAEAARDGAEQSIRYGTTCVADVVTDASAATALHDAGMRGVAYWEVMDWSNEQWRSHGIDAVNAALDAMPAQPAVGISPHAPYSLEAAPLLDLPDLARRRGIRLHLHLGESRMEAEWADGRSGMLADLWRSEVASFRAMRAGGIGYSATEFVDQLGVLGPDCHVAHGVYMTAEDRRRLRARSTAVALCLRSNRVIGLDDPPLTAYLTEGNQLAVGTDSLSSSPSLDVLGELPELFRLARSQGYANRDLGRRLLHSATLGGAIALGLSVGPSRIGQLQAGAIADMVFLDVPVSEIVDTIDDVVLHGAGRQVATLINGEVRWADPRFPR
ncbi:MAG: amidohydrolase family protein [Propionibacteriaceae bacterium]|nr:amidohydrolase family protein [Propionibacteriaceae bacterium]